MSKGITEYPEPAPAKCLHCGSDIPSIGRSDRKFCCNGCRHEYNNHKRRSYSVYRARTERKLNNNYRILRSLLDSGIDGIALQDITAKDFDINYATAVFYGGKHTEYNCFDIGYHISGTRISNIHQLELSLQNYKIKK